MRRVPGTLVGTLPIWIILFSPRPAPAEEPPPPVAAPAPAVGPSDAERVRQLELRLEALEARERARGPSPDPAPLPASSGGAPLTTALGGLRVGADFHDGFFLEAPNGAFRLHVGGLLQADGRYFPANEAPGPVDQFILRSARIELDGTVWRYVDFRFNADFGQGQQVLQDGWADLHPWQWLHLRVGKMKVPFGLERLQPEGRTAFLERGYPTDISPNRDIGALLWGEIADGTVWWGVGVYNGVVDNSTSADLELDADKEEVARLFFHPLRKTRFAALRNLGVGGAYSFAQLTGSLANPQLLSVKTDGLTSFFRYVSGAAIEDTAIAAGQRNRATAQAYYYFWRLGLLGEYVWNTQDVRRATRWATVTAQAWQGYATFLLTDDEASYVGVKPKRPLDLFAGHRGPGAWEIGFRYSAIQIGDEAFADSDTKHNFADLTKSPKSATSYTVGVNWYPNANSRFQVDYVRTDFTGGAAAGGNRPSENALMARLQYNL